MQDVVRLIQSVAPGQALRVLDPERQGNGAGSTCTSTSATHGSVSLINMRTCVAISCDSRGDLRIHFQVQIDVILQTGIPPAFCAQKRRAAGKHEQALLNMHPGRNMPPARTRSFFERL